LLDALSDLAGLAARGLGIPAALIRAGTASGPGTLAAYGDCENPEFTERLAISLSDHADETFGDLILLDRSPIALPPEKARLAEGLARQAAALLELGVQASPRPVSVEEQLARDLSGRIEAADRTRVFADIFRNIQVGVFVWKLEGPVAEARFRLLATNSAAARMTRLTIDDLIGKTMQEAFPGVHRSGLPENCAKVIASGQSLDLGDAPCGEGGEQYTAKIIPLPNETVAVVFDNVTEERRNREVLRQNEERYRLLFENNPQPMWLFDPDSLRFLNVNDAALTRYGYTREEFLALTVSDIWFEEDRAQFDQVMDALRKKRTLSGVRRHRRKDGSAIHAEVFHHYISFTTREAVIALSNDITDKLEALERLRHSEERYRTLAAISPVGLYRVDLNGRWSFVNEHMCRLLGWKLDELIGTEAPAIMHAGDVGWVTEAWHSAAGREEPFHAEYRILTKDGRIIWVMGNALTDKAPDGSRIGFVGTVTDITERKQAEILLACQKRTLALIASGLPLQEVLENLVQSVERESAGGIGAVLLTEAPGNELNWTAAATLPAAFRAACGLIPPDASGGPIGLAAERKASVHRPDLGAAGGTVGKRRCGMGYRPARPGPSWAPGGRFWASSPSSTPIPANRPLTIPSSWRRLRTWRSSPSSAIAKRRWPAKTRNCKR